MLKGQGIYKKALNRWFLDIEGIGEVELRYNLHQNRLYQDHVKKVREQLLKQAEKEKKEAQTASSDGTAPVKLTMTEMVAVTLELIIENRLVTGPENNLDICYLALNPANEEAFSREKINELFDLDIQAQIAKFYVEYKIMNPRFDAILDPQLAPLEAEMTQKRTEGPKETD